MVRVRVETFLELISLVRRLVRRAVNYATRDSTDGSLAEPSETLRSLICGAGAPYKSVFEGLF